MPASSPLEIAAPAAALDPLAPWLGARSSRERALAATFWTSFGGLSSLFHLTAICFSLLATLMPIPFLAEACSQVRPVAFRPPERVVMSIVEVEPPPLIEEIPPPPPIEDKPAASKGAKARRLEAELARMDVGVLALLGSADSNSSAFATLSGAEDGAVFGALMGDQIGDSFGAGGLGLSGVGVAGGVVGGIDGGTAIGIGGLGTLGTGGGASVGSGAGYGSGALADISTSGVRVDVIETDLDPAEARRALLRKKLALAACKDALPADFTLRVQDGKVSAAEGAPPCVERVLVGLPITGSGYLAVHFEAR